ncbi:carbohydrate ABC transporter permease [Streptomyces radicis]|uniref:Sugar ABC transporter permease n=1 Tax=Streptomyces radicis TaxID=1750517 RepID=A0A3A9WGS9_9ACTN|nr:sugar ABC transporter permease [Streptomyces radicis]RKN12155.1 sugar ABC transporter permease [Streptomyces radicis]RKN25792.1 sugar ABC transporter permease [Streptomyces radicis]
MSDTPPEGVPRAEQPSDGDDGHTVAYGRGKRERAAKGRPSAKGAATASGPPPRKRNRVPRFGRVERTVLERRFARLGWGFATPALFVVLAVTLFPIAYSVAMSLSHVEVSAGGFHLSGFTGEHYGLLLRSGRWWHALIFTVLYTIGTVLAELILGTIIALVLERLGGPGRGWMMALLLLPWAMITVVSAQLWAYMYNGVYGVLTSVSEGITGHPVQFLGTRFPAIISMAVADVWKTTPFVAIIVLAGLMMLPDDVNEAAKVDGAGAWTAFWKVRLPLLRPALTIAVLFRILQAFGIFDLPFVLTGGGPGDATESMALLGWHVMFTNLDFGPGAAVAASTALLVLVGCLLFLRAFRARVADEETTA